MILSLNAIRRHWLAAVLPLGLALASCGDDEPEPTPVVPDQGRVMMVHAAANANVGLKFLVDDAEKAQLNYGQNSAYQNVQTGSRVFKVNVATSGTNTATVTSTIEKDKSYSLYAFAPGAGSVVNGLLVTDDLAAPAANMAKIRVVHLAQSAPSPVKLTQVNAVGSTDLITNVAFGTASTYLSINAGTYNLAIAAGNPSITILNVGDGSGSGAGSRNYVAGKIYTVLVRGIANVDANLQPKAVIIENN